MKKKDYFYNLFKTKNLKKSMLFLLIVLLIFIFKANYIGNNYINKEIKTQSLDSDNNRVSSPDLSTNKFSGAKGLMGSTINAKDFGVKGDGSLEDCAQLQKALDYASSIKGILKIPSGTYKAWNLNVGDNTQIEMEINTVFDLTTAPTSTSAFNVLGKVGNAIPLTVGVPRNCTELKVALGSEKYFSAGDTIKITSNDFFDIDNRTIQNQGGQKKGELVKVASVENNGNNGIIRLVTPTVDEYSNTTGVSIRKITLKKGIRIKGGKVTGEGHLTQYGINSRYAEDLKIEHFQVENTFAFGLFLKDCINVRVDQCSFKDITEPKVGYGVVVVDASQDIIVTNSNFDRCKHSITTGGTGEGVSNRITFNNNNVENTVGDAIDSHATCRFMEIIGNTVNDSEGLGVNFEGLGVTIKGNVINSPKTGGVKIVNWTSESQTEYTVEENQINNPTGHGIRISKALTSGNYIIHSLVSKNTIIMQNQFISDFNSYHGIMLEGVEGCFVTDNVIENADRGIYADENSSNCVITGNNVKNNGRKMDVHGTGHIVENNIVS